MAKFVAPGPGHLRRSVEDEKLDLNSKKASLNVKLKKKFKVYQKIGTRGRKAPKDLTKKKAPLRIEASSTDSSREMNFMNLLKEEIMSREKTRGVPWADEAWEDHSNCCGQRAKMEVPDSPESSDDEWKFIRMPYPVPRPPLHMDGFPTIYFE